MPVPVKKLIETLKKSWLLIALCSGIIAGCFFFLLDHYLSTSHREDLVYKIESKILDLKLLNRGPLRTPTKVGVLAIDEKALTQFGRWPFSRKHYAQAFKNLKKLGVKWIGFDAVWAEPERTFLEDAKPVLRSLDAKNYPAKLDAIAHMIKTSPSDEIFARAIRDFGNIIMGYFYFGSKVEAKLNAGHRKPFKGFAAMAEASAIPGDFMTFPVGKSLKDYPNIKSGYGVVGNTDLYAEAGEHFAFFSNDADDDAINRWVTMVAKLNGKLMPSLSLLSAANYLERGIIVSFDALGIDSIILFDEEENKTEIPIDPKGRGRILVNHRGGSGGFYHYSLADAYNNKFTAKERQGLKDSLLLLGATATGINDMRPNPFDPAIDGVENHAAAIDNILTRNFMKRPQNIFKTELAIVLGVGLLAAPLMIWGRALVAGIAMLSFLIGYYFVDKYLWFGQGVWTYMAVPSLEIVVLFLCTNLVKYMSEEKDKKFLKQAFGSYISPELIDEMYASGEPPKLGGNSGILSAYFTDIQSFSSFSEQLSATQLVELLNEYLTAMTDILLEEKGTLDKYEGDAIIAFFGAPMELKDHATRACLVACKMQATLLELRKKWVAEGERWPQIVKEMRMRIGINSGEIVTGNMGSRDRMNYTMMGDAVNLAARLEEAAKQYGIFTQISQHTRDLAGPENFVMRELDTIRVVGKKEPVTTYELMGIAGQTGDGLVRLAKLFEDGVKLYKAQEWDQATAKFQETLALEYQRYPELKGKKTNPSLIYLERCAAFKATPPGADWDGVYTLTSK